MEGTYSIIDTKGTRIRSWITTEANGLRYFLNITGVGPDRIRLVGPTGLVLR